VISDEQRRLLGAFLVRRRCAIDPQTRVLGTHPRSIHAIGNAVTQHEIADACGINRRWYELAENGEQVRASAGLAYTLGSVLGLTAEDRELLVNLATPYLSPETPRDDSTEIAHAFGSMRSYLHKLNACSSTNEILRLVQETAASLFPRAPYIVPVVRHTGGGWSFHGDAIVEASRFEAFMRDRTDVILPILEADPLAADVITCFPQASLPGDLATYELHDMAALAQVLGKRYEAFKQLHETELAGVIRTRNGFVGHLYLGEFRKHYDGKTEHSLVSAITDFASLAAVP
jgi:hypothetical protein